MGKFSKSIIIRQLSEINKLKKENAELKMLIENKKSNEIFSEKESDLDAVVKELRNKKIEYENLISELMEIRDSMNRIVFGKKWKLMRFIIDL